MKVVLEFTIAQGAATSTSYNLSDLADPTLRNRGQLLGVIAPAMTGTAMTLQASLDGSTWYPVMDISNNAFTIVTSSTATWFDTMVYKLSSLKHVRFVSGSTEAAARTIRAVYGLV